MRPALAAGRWIAMVLGIGVVALGGVLAVAVLRQRPHPAGGGYAVPGVQSGAAMAFDPASRGVILFGGVDSSGNDLAGTWLWDGTGWSKLSPPVSPPARRDAVLGWDPSGNQLILTGGDAIATGAPTPTSHVMCPMIRAQGAGTAADATASLTPITPGVITSTCAQPQTLKNFTDTWAFDGTTWKQLQPAHQAFTATDAARVHLATDTATSSLLLVAPMSPGAAGATAIACPLQRAPISSTVPNDVCNFTAQQNVVFAWKNGDWVRQTATFSGVVQALAADPSTGNVAAVVGPSSPACTCCGLVSPAQSNSIQPPQAGAPKAVTAPAIAYPCPAVAASSAEAGTTAYQFRSEVREWHDGQWVNVTTSGSPAGIYLYAASDSTHNELMVLTSGGQTWGLSKGVWTKRADSDPLEAPLQKPVQTPLGIATPGKAVAIAGSNSEMPVTQYSAYSGLLSDDPQAGDVTLLRYPAPVGGTNTPSTTWEWNGTAWQQAGPATTASPSPTSTPETTPIACVTAVAALAGVPASPIASATPTLLPTPGESAEPSRCLSPIATATPSAPAASARPLPASSPTPHAVPGGNGPPAAIN